jgi:hypothetical protein
MAIAHELRIATASKLSIPTATKVSPRWGLRGNRTPPITVQEDLLRHACFTTTMNIYTQAVFRSLQLLFDCLYRKKELLNASCR